MPGNTYLISLLGLLGTGAIISLAFLLASKIQRLKQLQATIEDLKRSLGVMDEQAKLVVRTDMELNKAQEELDKKITGLYTLQKLSQAISTALEENQIFNLIEPSYLEDLGFKKACAFLWNDREKSFRMHINIGYSENASEELKAEVNLDKAVYLHLIKAHKTDPALKNKIKAVFKVSSFIISPLLPKEGSQGFLFVGTEDREDSITEGEEELITVLSNQLGQALENARLFEKTWAAQQELEKRVQERTHELSLALEEVKKISQRKTDFVSSVTHELRTPLTSIKGYASILLTEKLGTLPQEVLLRLEKINRHSDELAHFVNELLDISRIEAGRVTMKLEPLDLKRISEEIIELLSEQLKEKQIESPLDIADNAKLVLADLSQIKRVFINILGNALKFTPPKGKITISAHRRENEVQINISDSGCGIPEEAKGLIFEEFYRVDNDINQEVKGTGLGLALVKNIIEAHKGRIWVSSKVGAGSTFSFTLPKAP